MILAKEHTQTTFNNIPFYNYDIDSLSEKELSIDQVKHFRMLNELTEMSAENKGIFTNSVHEKLVSNNYAFSIKVLNDKPYKHNGFTLIELRLNYCFSKPIALYIDNDRLKTLENVSINFSIYKPYN